MKRPIAFLGLLILALLIGGATSAFHSSSAQAAQLGSPAPSAPVADYPGADYVGAYQQDCLPGNRVRVSLNWQTYNTGGQWIDLSLYNNGFFPGTFIGLGPFPAGQSTFIWDGLLPGYTHYLRVNTLTPYGWIPSQTLVFTTRNDCYYTAPVDSDYDGIPDAQDACPYTQGIPAYAGCPAPYPPQPTPTPCITTSSIIVGNYTGCVTTDKATYSVGQGVTYCYSVSQPMNVRIVATKPDGSQLTVLQGYDNGTGGCLQPIATGYPLGVRTVDMYGGPSFQLLSEIHFTVQ